MILSDEMSKNVLQVKHTSHMADSYTALLYNILTFKNGVLYNTKGSHSTAILLIKSSSNKTGSVHMTLTSRCVRATITAVEKHQVLRIWSGYSLTHPACNVHALYHHLSPAPLNNIFSHYCINDMISEKIYIEHKMCVLIFSTSVV
jgi:hypothetical protein